MHVGVYIFPTDKTLQPIALAKAVEERGFESLWFPEHSHIPAGRQTPWGGREGAPPLPEHYWRTHDQFVALAACAAVTTTLRLGTGITLVAQRDPIWLAKQVASLDTISNGRLLFGIGYGWNKEEMAHHGIPYQERRAILREKILAMKQIWTEDEPSFSGDHITVEPSWSWPKPLQKPHPPIVLGGSAGPRTMRDIIEFCDGWMPLGGKSILSTKIEELRKMAEDAGRDPDSIKIGWFGPTKGAADLHAFAEAGLERVVLAVASAPPDEVLAELDRHAAMVEEFRG